MKIKRMRYKRKKVFFALFLFLLIVGIGVGYALITTKLSIEGVAKVKDAKWNIYFTNIQPSQGSVTPTTAPSITDTNITFSARLNDPSDYYEFTVDVVNGGTINAELSGISVTPDFDSIPYVDYSIAYDDDTELQAGDLLKTGAIKRIKVHFNYVEGLEDEVYPTADQTYSVSVGLNYVQCMNKNINSFAKDSWSEIATNVASDPKTYDVGERKRVELDMNGDDQISTDEIYYVRVANNTTPTECSQTGFSQTACGFVVEFEKPIYYNKMFNNTTTSGGYPASIVYTTYIKNNSSNWLYNKLPSDLKDGIIDTFTVSGYETGKTANYETTDKLYLLSTHEIMEDADGNVNAGINFYDKSYDSTRQLDYYKLLNVTTNSYSNASKNYNYWTRSSYSGNRYFYLVNSEGNIISSSPSGNNYVIPAFRIGSNN